MNVCAAHWTRGQPITSLQPITSPHVNGGVGLITVGYREQRPPKLSNVLQLGPSYKYLSKAIVGNVFYN